MHAGRLVDLVPHLERLGRSLGALRIAWPMSRAALSQVLGETVRRNGVRTGMVYLQITRGTAPRGHVFPPAAVPSVVVTARRLAPPSAAARSRGVAVVTMPDLRWGRCDIKSVSLLANVLARQDAAEAGAYEAWLVDGAGNITEGSASNAWIVDADGVLRTRDLGTAILAGVTRAALLEACASSGVAVAERAFSAAELAAAREALLTSTTARVLPVVAVDGRPVGDGRPGPVFLQLDRLYRAHLGTPA